ncbi:MAG: hypothetical protein QM757_42395 [Paludibaculum sp.]
MERDDVAGDVQGLSHIADFEGEVEASGLADLQNEGFDLEGAEALGGRGEGIGGGGQERYRERAACFGGGFAGDVGLEIGDLDEDSGQARAARVGGDAGNGTCDLLGGRKADESNASETNFDISFMDEPLG